MKLYATISSDRASKGQGGNEYLDIEVFNENQEKIAGMELQVRENEIYLETIANDETGEYPKEIYSIPLPKGKKEKGDKCPTCQTILKKTDYMCPNDDCLDNRV